MKRGGLFMPFFLDSLKNILKESIPDIVIKYSVKAKEFETVETKREGDQYVCAKMKIDTFGNYLKFPREVLQSAGFTDNEINQFLNHPEDIPYNRRDSVLNEMRKYIVNNYVEKNNYYRMLHGLPDMEDNEEIWMDYELYEKYDVPPAPIHEVSHDNLLMLESFGEIQKLIDRFPEKTYLTFLGKRRVELTIARLADNFEILYFPRIAGQDNFYKEFMMTYESCREYFMSIIYNRFYTSKYDQYDNFIAFDILIMAINKMISSALIRFKQREFYDIETMKIFLNAYGVPLVSTLNIQQLRLLCKNINILLKEKCTNKVFIDIMDLLNFGNIQVKKYYLIKQRKMTESGKPMFIYKTDEHGNHTDELDLEKMYDFYFLHTAIDNYRIQSIDMADKIDYRNMISGDLYWQEDEKLKNKLLHSKFNYIETKYIDFDVIYRMQNLLFETEHLTRIVLDNPITKSIPISLAKLVSNDVRVYNAFLFLICMMCKYYHVKPSLLTTPSKVMYIKQFDFDKDLKVIVQDIEGKCKTINSTKIFGFNFNANLTKIQEDVANNRKLDKRLLKYINALVLKDVNAINSMYLQVRELRSLLIEQMMKAESIEVYNAYDKLYQTLLTTDYNRENFKLKDGTIPESYDECLKEADYALYECYTKANTEDEISDIIDYVTERFTTLFQDTKYLNQMKIMDKRQVQNIIKLLNFFKSYTVMIKDMNFLIVLDDKYLNTIYMKSGLQFESDIIIDDRSHVNELYDGLNRLYGYERINKTVELDNQQLFLTDITPHTDSKFNDKSFYKPRLLSNNRMYINHQIKKYLNKFKAHQKLKYIEGQTMGGTISTIDKSELVNHAKYKSVIKRYINKCLHIKPKYNGTMNIKPIYIQFEEEYGMITSLSIHELNKLDFNLSVLEHVKHNSNVLVLSRQKYQSELQSNCDRMKFIDQFAMEDNQLTQHEKTTLIAAPNISQYVQHTSYFNVKMRPIFNTNLPINQTIGMKESIKFIYHD